MKLSKEMQHKLEDLENNPRAWKLLGIGYGILLLLVILGFFTIILQPS
jgi:hypothetical protein